MLQDVAKDAGSTAAKTVSDAAQNVSQELGRDLADAVNILAGSADRLRETVAEESTSWRQEVAALRAEYARTNDALARVAAKLERLQISLT